MNFGWRISLYRAVDMPVSNSGRCKKASPFVLSIFGVDCYKCCCFLFLKLVLCLQLKNSHLKKGFCRFCCCCHCHCVLIQISHSSIYSAIAHLHHHCFTHMMEEKTSTGKSINLYIKYLCWSHKFMRNWLWFFFCCGSHSNRSYKYHCAIFIHAAIWWNRYHRHRLLNCFLRLHR